MFSRGAISLVFDDGYREVFEKVLPLLKKYGIRATFAVPVNTDYVAEREKAYLTSFAEWKSALEKDGHELAAHGTNHLAFTRLSDSDLWSELHVAKEQTSASTLVYPGGAHDKRVKKLASEFFKIARSTTWGIESNPPSDKFALKTINATNKNFRVWKWNLMALWALFAGKWLIETYHRFNAEDLHSVDIGAFENHIKFLNKLKISIVMLRDKNYQ